MSNKSATLARPGGPASAMIGKKKEKLKNPKETMGRLLKYIGSKKLALVIVFILCIVTTVTTIIGTKYNGEVVDKFIAVGNMKGLFNICIKE